MAALLFNTNYINAFAAETNTTENLINKDTSVTNASTVKAKVTVKSKKKSYTSAQLKYLACLIQAEAGNQSYTGKLAVANVVLNRVKNKAYPSSIKGVIYDRKWSVQFTVAYNGRLSKELKKFSHYSTKAQKLSVKAAKEALEGNNNIGSYKHFTVYSKYLARKHANHKKIGAHIFF